MTNATPPLDNFERLSKQLKSGSLAARLVAAYIGAGDAAARGAALKAVISVRLNELRQSHAAGTDQ